MKRVAIYARVSTREQHPENQLIKLKEYAERHSYKYEVFEETESTRKTRPVKAALMDRLRRKEFEGVIVLKFDRWARSSIELALEVEEIYSKGIKFISVDDGMDIDMESPTGVLQFRILSAFAEFEREMIRQRTLDGLDRAVAQGKQLGRPAGSKDKNGRRKSGYYLRWSGKNSSPVKNAKSAVLV